MDETTNEERRIFVSIPTDTLNVSSPRHVRNAQIANPLNDASSLLVSWNLAHLCDTFRDQEVCTMAFEHITDTDINELIPKIGPRAIFRAHLAEWRREKDNQKTPKMNSTNVPNSHKRSFQTAFSNLNTPQENFVGQSVLKIESVDTDAQWLGEGASAPAEPQENGVFEILQSSSSSMQGDELQVELVPTVQMNDSSSEENTQTGDKQNDTGESSLLNFTQFSEKCLNVGETLSKSFDGRKAMEYYKTNETLDINHRKKIVKIIIGAVIENQIGMSVSIFQDLAQQFVDLFPSESCNTYYIPRKGSTCPRGALYNKYLNMSRRLRRDGLLDYRVQRRSTTRQFGGVVAPPPT